MDKERADGAGVIRIVIAEDHGLVADGLSAMLSVEGDMEVIEVVTSGEALVESVDRHRPDVALVDVKLIGMDGLTAVREIVQRGGPTRMMALTMSTDQSTVARAVAAGVAGYLPKDVRREELIEAVRAVASGKGFLHPDVARAFLNLVGTTSSPGLTPLSNREQDVLEQLAAGRSTREIAAALTLGEETVKSHLSRIYSKLNANDRVQAVVTAMRHGMVR